MSIEKTIGILVGDEVDWPATLEARIKRIGPVKYGGKTYSVGTRRMRIDPFSLKDPSKCDVIIDRLAYWHFAPREWLKKVALIDGTYLLNNPFTFQSMEKHSAYCAMVRLGLHIPETWLIPQKTAPTAFKEKYRRTAERYHNLFDLPEIAESIGYPLFMKPFDGGGWREVTKIKDRDGLIRAYNASGQTLMHLQQGLDDYDVFTRSLAIGPQVTSLKFCPEKPHHARYQVEHGFLDADAGREVRIITKLVNSFFRWDFNSCETIHKDGKIWPIDFANACPDIAVTSLHYYYPWAIKALLSWSIFSAVSERPMKIAMNPDPYFEIADSDRSYEEKLTAYEALADAHFQREEFEAFREDQLSGLDEAMWELAQTEEFAEIIEKTVAVTFPPNEHSAFSEHFKGLLGHWVQSTDPNPEEAPAEAAEGDAPAEKPVEGETGK